MQFCRQAGNVLGDPDANQANLALLEESLDRLVPFVGAGLSMPLGYPSWLTFLRDLGNRLGLREEVERDIARGQLEEAAGLLAKSPDFDEYFAEAFSEDKIPTPLTAGAVSHLAAVAQGPVLTTNFDRVLEHAFLDARRPFDEVFAGATIREAAGAIQMQRRVLLKLHGDYAAPSERVLTVNEYIREYGSATPGAVDLSRTIPSILQQALGACPLLFLGCSLESDRTTNVIAAIAKRWPTLRHFAVLAEASKKPELLSRLEAWNILPLFFRERQYERIEAFLSALSEHVFPRPLRGPLTNLETKALPRTNALVADDTLDREVDAKLRNAGLSIPHCCAVYGLPGSGKTMFAAVMARRYVAVRGLDIIWWISSTSEETLEADLVMLAQQLHLLEPGVRTYDSGLIDKLRACLKKRSCLFIYDDIKDIDTLERFLVATSGGNVLATSLSTLWRDIGIRHSEWTAAQASDYVRRRLAPDVPTPQHVELLVNRLACHALALEQATTYILVAHVTIVEYLRLLDIAPRDILDDANPASSRLHQKKTVYGTCRLLLERIRRELPDALHIVGAIARVGNENIPRKLILESFCSIQDNRDSSAPAPEIRFNACVSLLSEYSLVRLSPRSITVHGLLHTALRLWIEQYWIASGAGQGVLDCIVASVVRGLEAHTSLEEWNERQAILPHALALVRLSDVRDVLPEALFHRLNETLGDLLESRETPSSLTMLSAITKGRFGDKSITYNRIVYQQANLARHEGRFDDATAMLEAIERRISGEVGERELLWAISKQYGYMQFERGQYTDANASYGRCLNQLAALGRYMSVDTIHVMCAAGRALQIQGKYNESLLMLDQSREINHVLRCPDADSTAGIAVLRGDVLIKLNRRDEARDEFQKALDIVVAAFPRAHLAVGSLYNSIGNVYLYEGEWKAAMTNLKIGRYLVGRGYGITHTAYGRQLCDVGLVFLYNRKLDAADRLFYKAELLYGARNGEWYIGVAIARYYRGLVAIRKRQFDLAMTLLAMSLEILNKWPESNSERRAQIVRDCVVASLGSGALQEADGFAQELRSLREAQHQENPYERSRDSIVLAEVAFLNGYMSSDIFKQRVLAEVDVISALWGVRNPSVVATLDAIRDGSEGSEFIPFSV